MKEATLNLKIENVNEVVSNMKEAKSIVNIIKKNNYHDVGIVTPFVNQAALINQYLQDNTKTKKLKYTKKK